MNISTQIVITGASDGIGKEFASQLAKKKFNVLLVSRTESKLQALAQELGKFVQDSHLHYTDNTSANCSTQSKPMVSRPRFMLWTLPKETQPTTLTLDKLSTVSMLVC